LAAVILKVIVSGITNPAMVSFVLDQFGAGLVPALGGILIGLQSSLFEVGLTLVAVMIWSQLGLNSNRAIAIGIGAGTFEALLIGLSQIASTSMALSGAPGTGAILQQLNPEVLPTLFWLIAPVERTIAILSHASSRALVLLGQPRRRPWLVLAGFGIFAALDSIAAGAQLTGLPSRNALWLIEAALLPIGLASLVILRWCQQQWPRQEAPPTEAEAPAGVQ
jgi:uncharacterized membrane protein YhfC